MLTDKELQVLLLRERGLKQIEIAEKLGITQGAVSRFEQNSRKKVRDALTSLDILQQLNINLDEQPLGSREKTELIRQTLRGGHK